MSNHCSINPQVYNGSKLVDSELFDSIRKKGLGRDWTKHVYNAYKSKDFSNMFGDWQLYRNAVHNRLTPSQNATFYTLYNGNIELLKSSLLIDLDSNLEPLELKQSSNFKAVTASLFETEVRGRLIRFNDEDAIKKMANRLGITKSQLINQLLEHSSIVLDNTSQIIFREENKITNPSYKAGVADLYQDYSHIPTIGKTAISGRDVMSIDFNQYKLDETIYLSKIISMAVINDYDNFVGMLRSNKKESNVESVTRLNNAIRNYIIGMGKQASQSIKTKIEIAKSQNDTSVDLLEAHLLTVQKAYKDLINQFVISDDYKLSPLQDSLFMYLRKEYGLNIKSTNDLLLIQESSGEDAAGVEDIDRVVHRWDDADLGRIDYSDSIPVNLKRAIAISSAKDTMDNLTNNISLDSKYGIQEPISVKDVWGMLLNVSNNNNTMDGIIAELELANTYDFNGRITSFIDALKTDENLQKDFYKSVVLPIIPSTSITITKETKINKANERQLNYGVNPVNIARSEFMKEIELHIENGDSYLSQYTQGTKSGSEMSIKSNRAESTHIKYNLINKYIGILGISLNEISIQRYIQSKTGIITGFVSNPFDSVKIPGTKVTNRLELLTLPIEQRGVNFTSQYLLTPEEVNIVTAKYNEVLNEMIGALETLMYDLKGIKNTKKGKNKFRKLFNQSGSVNVLAEIGAVSRYNLVNQSYYSTTGNMIHSPQLPSHITDIMKVLKTTINDDHAVIKEKMSKFLNDPTLKRNRFLYNIDGTGIFNLDEKSSTPGNPVLHPDKIINTNFIKTFDFSQLSGMEFTDLGKGVEYREIKGDTWNMLSIINVLKGIYVIPTAESSRSMFVKGSRYGLNGFNTDSDGNYNSFKSILSQVGIEFINNQARLHTNDDLSEDYKFIHSTGTYMGSKNDFSYKIYSAKDVAESSNSIHAIYDKLSTSVYEHIERYLDNLDRNPSMTIKVPDSILNIYKEVVSKTSLTPLFSSGLQTKIKRDGGKAHRLEMTNELYHMFNGSQSVDASRLEIGDMDFTATNAKMGISIVSIYNQAMADGIESDIEAYDRFNKYRQDPMKMVEANNMFVKYYKEFINTNNTFNAVKDVMLSEMDTIRTVFKSMFEIKREYIPESKKYLVQNIEASKEAISQFKQGRLNTLQFSNGGTLIKNGVPTGRIFSLDHMTYIKDGVSYNIFDFAKSVGVSKVKMYDLIMRSTIESNDLSNKGLSSGEVMEDTMLSKNILDGIINDFLETMFVNRQNEFIARTENIKEDIQKFVVDYTPKYVNRTYAGEYSGMRHSSYLISTHLEANSERNQEVLDKYYNQAMLETYLNYLINDYNIGSSLVYGKYYNYKNLLDWNKRVPQAIKNGKSTNSTEKFKSLTIADLNLRTNVYTELHDSLIKRGFDTSQFEKDFNNNITSADGLSIITVPELIKRYKAFNMYDGQYKDYIDQLSDPNVELDLSKVHYIVEQMKFFLFTIQPSTNTFTSGINTPYQEKNSTIVLFPKLIRGTQFEAINNWMLKEGNNIGELNFASASKVGDQSPVAIHNPIYAKDENGDILKDMEGKDIIESYDVPIKIENGQPMLDVSFNPNDYAVEYEVNVLRIQQELVGHIKDEKGILASQAERKAFVNLDANDDFVINKMSYKGKTGNNAKGKRGLYENMQLARSYNAKEDWYSLLYDFGAIENGEIKYNDDGTIKADLAKVRQYVTDYQNKQGNIALYHALNMNENKGEESRLSLSHPTIITMVESLLQSKVSKITEDKLRQIHGSIVPDSFMNPYQQEYGKKDIYGDEYLKEFVDKSLISFSEDFIIEQSASKSWELKPERPDGKGNNLPAQIILNPWDSRFDKYRDSNGKVNIDEIPRESRIVYATRIPHEGKQSSFVGEVVGFFNTGASQIMVPRHLVTRSGQDYDIDTIYIYPKELYRRSDGKLYPISYEFDELNKEDKYSTRETQIKDLINIRYKDKLKVLQDRKKAAISKVFSDFEKGFKSKKTELKANDIADTKSNSQDELYLINKYKDALDESGVITPTMQAISNIIKQLNSEQDKLDTDLLNTVKSMIQDTISEDGLDIDLHAIERETNRHESSSKSVYKEEMSKFAKLEYDKLKNTLTQIKDNHRKALEELYSDKEINKVFDNLEEFEKIPRKMRNNMVIDTMITLTLDPRMDLLRDKANNYDELKEVSEYILDVADMSTSNSSSSSILDVANITNMTKTVSQNKAISINMDNAYAVLGSVGAKFDGSNAVPIAVDYSEFNTDDKTEIIKRLNDSVGNGNYRMLEDKVIVISTGIGNNINGTWTNLAGDRISRQSSQLTANILDAVKDRMGFNVDAGTIGILALFANNPIVQNIDFGKGAKPNAYGYANLLIHQPIISEFIRMTEVNKRYGNDGNKNYVFKKIKNSVQSKILASIYNMNFGVNLFDVYKSTLFNSDKHSNAKSKEQVVVESWIKNIEAGMDIDLYHKSGISNESIYNDFIEFITSSELSNNVIKYANLIELDISNIDLDSLSELSNSKLDTIIDNGKIISQNKKGFVFKSDNYYKSATELKSLFEQGYKKYNGNFNYLYDTVNHNDEGSIVSHSYKKLSNSELIAFMEYANHQLVISQIYQHMDSSADVVNRAARVLKADRLGSAPNSGITRSLVEDINNLYLNYNSIESDLIRVGYSNLDINAFKRKYYDLESIYDKEKFLTSFIKTHNEKGNGFDGVTMPKDFNSNSVTNPKKMLDVKAFRVGINVGTKQLVESIFPNYIAGRSGEQFIMGLSSIPYIESQFNFTNTTSQVLFTNILLSEKPYISKMINTILARVNANRYTNPTVEARLRTKILQTIMNASIYEDVPFFNGGGLEVSRRALKSKILGEVLVVEDAVLEDADVEMETTGVTSNVVTDISLSEILEMGYDKFDSLSAANKLLIVKKYITNINNLRGESNINNLKEVSDFLSMFDVALGKDQLRKNGYHKILLKETPRDMAKYQSIFRNMFHNKNKWVSSLAKDLIRYTFYTSGLGYGSNMAKFIDISLYYDDSGYNVNDNDFDKLSSYNEALVKLMKESDNNKLDDTYIDYLVDTIHRQLFDDASINPIVRAVNKTQDTESVFQTYVGEGEIQYPILVESKEKIDNNSWYNKNDYIQFPMVKTIFYNSDHGVVDTRIQDVMLMKRYQIPGDNSTYYYYPISKRLPSEFEETSVNSFKRNIEPESFYKDIIFKMHKESNPNNMRDVTSIFPIDRIDYLDSHARNSDSSIHLYPLTISKSNSDYINTAKELISKSDVVLFVGNNKFLKEFWSSDKTINVTDDMTGLEMEHLNWYDGMNLTIAGDFLSHTKYSQPELDAKLVPIFRNIFDKYNVSKVNVVYKNGIGESVMKSLIAKNLNKEFIEIGELNNVRDVQAMSNEIINGSDLNFNFNLQDLFDTQTTIISAINKLPSELRKTPFGKPDTFSSNTQALKQLINDFKEGDNYESILARIIDNNTQLIDNIVQYMHGNEFKLDKDDDVNTIGRFDMFKYMNRSDNADVKKAIVDKLHMFSIILKVAEVTMNMGTIIAESPYSERFNAELEAMKNEISPYYKMQDPRLENPSEKDYKLYSRQAAISALNNKVNNRIKEYLGYQIWFNSRNPKFINSRYNQLVNQIIRGSEISENIVDDSARDEDIRIGVTSKQLAEIYDVAIKYNDDLNLAQAYLDSAYDTGIPIVDVIMGNHMEYIIRAEEIKEEKLDKLHDIVKSYNGSSKIKWSLANERHYASRFINHETNKFISEYKWDAFYDDNHTSKNPTLLRRRALNELTLDEAMEYGDSISEMNMLFSNMSDKFKRKLNIRKSIESIREPLKFILENIKQPNELQKKWLDESWIKNDSKSKMNHNYGTNYYKLFSIQVGDTAYDVAVVTRDGRSMGLEPKSNNIAYINKATGETATGLEINDSAYSLISRSKASMTDSHIGYMEEIDVEDEPLLYQTYINEYLNKEYVYDSTSKYRFEQRNHIYIMDGMNEVVNPQNPKENDPGSMGVVYKKHKVVPKKEAREKINADYIKGNQQDIRIFRIIPRDEYLDPAYNRLSESEKIFLKSVKDYINDVILDVAPERIYDETFIPYIFARKGNALKEFFSYRSIQKGDFEVDILGNVNHEYNIRSLKDTQVKDAIKIPRKKKGQLTSEYMHEILVSANKALDFIKSQGRHKEVEAFTSIDQVFTYNKKVANDYITKNKDMFIFDIPAVLLEFTEEMYKVKGNSDFDTHYKMLLGVLGSDDFQAMDKTLSGKAILDKPLSFLKGERTYARKKGKNTRAYGRLAAHSNVLHGVSRTNTKADQLAGTLNRISSMNVMWFNYHTGIKNIMKGFSDIMIESHAKEFIDRKTLGKGIGAFRKNIPHLFAEMNTNKLVNIDHALINHFGHIFEDHTEGAIHKQMGSIFSKGVNFAENFGYAFNTYGEMFMQMSMILALTHSHRVIDTRVDKSVNDASVTFMNENEYIGDRRRFIMSKYLSESDAKEFNEYLEKAKKTERSKYRMDDHMTNWLTHNQSKFSNLKEMANEMSNEIKKAKEEFKKFETVHQQFIFKDGKLTVKDGFKGTQLAKFTDRAKSINQTMHGIYNTVDRGAIQNHLISEMFLQFRKWVRPNWIRWFGAKYKPLSSKDNSPFSERMGQYRSGAFADFSRFMRSPFIQNIYNSEEDSEGRTVIRAFVNGIRQYPAFLANMRSIYRMQNEHTKANIRRVVALNIEIVAVLAILTTLGMFSDDDDLDPTVRKMNEWATYNTAGLLTEYWDILPIIGWYNFYDRTKESVFPAEKQIGDAIKFVNELVGWSFKDEYDKYYTTGIYKGQNKLKIKGIKLLPVGRQLQKELYLTNSINYYKMYNPFF